MCERRSIGSLFFLQCNIPIAIYRRYTRLGVFSLSAIYLTPGGVPAIRRSVTRRSCSLKVTDVTDAIWLANNKYVSASHAKKIWYHAPLSLSLSLARAYRSVGPYLYLVIPFNHHLTGVSLAVSLREDLVRILYWIFNKIIWTKHTKFDKHLILIIVTIHRYNVIYVLICFGGIRLTFKVFHSVKWWLKYIYKYIYFFN